MTLYDFLACAIHRLTNSTDIDWINIIDYKRGIEFPILRHENGGWWDYETETVSRYKILHIISEQVEEHSTVLNIIAEECEVDDEN